jgi:hypothetical protein
MRKGLVLAAVLVLGWLARPADAHIVEVTTSIELEEASEATLEETIHKAVAQVLGQTIAFEPTLVAVTGSRVVGKRLIVRLMIMDEAGERLLREFADGLDPAPEGPPTAPASEVRT